MTKKWPSFETWDLDLDTDEGDAEMEQRGRVYRDEMAALIAAGGVHEDKDGWWVDDATGELIGPDPDYVCPMTDEQLANFKPMTFAEAMAAHLKRERGEEPEPEKE